MFRSLAAALIARVAHRFIVWADGVIARNLWSDEPADAPASRFDRADGVGR